jgi:hypothetical protein
MGQAGGVIMKESRLFGAVCASVFSFISMSSHAALIDRGGGLIYDDVLDITWLQDASYASTIGHPDSGLMTWAEANAWVANLSYFDSVRSVTYDDWRLPTASPINGTTFDTNFSNNATTDAGFAPTTTDGTDGGWRDGAGNPVHEMGHLWYVTLGNLGECTPDNDNPSGCIPQLGSGLSNSGPFTNILPLGYWSDPEFDSGSVLRFDIQFGDRFLHTNLDSPSPPTNVVWAVRSGDVVPVPAAAWLFVSGLIGLIGVAKRKKSLL